MSKRRGHRGRMLLLWMCLLIVFGSCSVEANSTDVTQKYKSQVTNLLAPFETFLGDGCIRRMNNRFNDYYRTGMVARIRGANVPLIDGMNVSQAKKILKSKVKLYFGTKKIKFIKYKAGMITSPAYSYQILGNKLRPMYGQWGDVYPIGEVEKIIKSGKKYIVSYLIRFYIAERGTYGEDMGRYQITLKKAKNRNGFIIKNVKRTQTYLVFA